MRQLRLQHKYYIAVDEHVSKKASKMLSSEEVLRCLNTVRYSPQAERNARRSQSINSIAKQAGLTRAALYEMMRTGRMQLRSQARLSEVFETCQGVYGARTGGRSTGQS